MKRPRVQISVAARECLNFCSRIYLEGMLMLKSSHAMESKYMFVFTLLVQYTEIQHHD